MFTACIEHRARARNVNRRLINSWDRFHEKGLAHVFFKISNFVIF